MEIKHNISRAFMMALFLAFGLSEVQVAVCAEPPIEGFFDIRFPGGGEQRILFTNRTQVTQQEIAEMANVLPELGIAPQPGNVVNGVKEADGSITFEHDGYHYRLWGAWEKHKIPSPISAVDSSGGDDSHKLPPPPASPSTNLACVDDDFPVSPQVDQLDRPIVPHASTKKPIIIPQPIKPLPHTPVTINRSTTEDPIIVNSEKEPREAATVNTKKPTAAIRCN